ncbi:MAG: cardiolipin synthase ClsB [Betaproteobacteria bacterium]
MRRFTSGNRISLLRNGTEYFPALLDAIAAARDEIYLECYIFAADVTGLRVAEALQRAAGRGVRVHVLVDGWGAKNFLSPYLIDNLRSAGVQFAKYRPEVAPWQFRTRRLRRLHRKLVCIDRDIAFIGGINIIDDMNTPGHVPPRIDFAVRVEGPVVSSVVQTMLYVWTFIQFAQMKEAGDALFQLPPPPQVKRVGNQTAKLVIRDNLRNRREIEQAYLTAIHSARTEILIANAYFLPGVRFRQALVAAAERGVRVTLLLQGQVEYVLLRYASRALYGQLLQAGVEIQEHYGSFLHAKVAVIDRRWATVGSSNIDPFSLLMSREANIVVRNAGFADELRREVLEIIASGARQLVPDDWRNRSPVHKAAVWAAYGFVRFTMGIFGYGSEVRLHIGE